LAEPGHRRRGDGYELGIGGHEFSAAAPLETENGSLTLAGRFFFGELKKGVETITLHVDGMTCEGCARGVARVLKKVDGVASAEVSLDKAEAKVAFDPGKVSVAQMKAALETAGYQAR
jgi:copper chaperone